MMKKEWISRLAIMFMAVVFSFALAACGSDSDDENPQEENPQEKKEEAVTVDSTASHIGIHYIEVTLSGDVDKMSYLAFSGVDTDGNYLRYPKCDLSNGLTMTVNYGQQKVPMLVYDLADQTVTYCKAYSNVSNCQRFGAAIDFGARGTCTVTMTCKATVNGKVIAYGQKTVTATKETGIAFDDADGSFREVDMSSINY